jgi:hypothetical protein
VRICLCTYVPVASARTVGRILPMFDIQEFITDRPMSVKYEHSRSKSKGSSQGPPPPIRKINAIISKTANQDIG